jgi:hypothetical protein
VLKDPQTDFTFLPFTSDRGVDIYLHFVILIRQRPFEDQLRSRTAFILITVTFEELDSYNNNNNDYNYIFHYVFPN